MRTGFPDWAARLGDDHVIDLGLLSAISDTALTRDVAITMRQDGLPNTFVPGRNIVFLTFAAAVAYRRGLKHIVTGVCETDYSGYPDCRDDTIKALQVTIGLGMDRRFVIETPLMWIDKAATWALANALGGEPLRMGDRRGDPHMLPRRSDAPSCLGRRVRRLPRLRSAPAGLGYFRGRPRDTAARDTENIMPDPLSPDLLRKMDAYWRAANYLSVGQIYLRDNPLLETPLAPEHIKPRLLGHWGTTPGLNFLYVHLNRLIKQHDLNMMYVIGPGHGGPGIVANSYLEGSYTEHYPAIERSRNGLHRLFRQFSWPYGVPSHVSPDVPGSIHEGGELGYSLLHAYGAAFDNPDLIVACVVGDGESETGPLAASWHSNKFLNPARDGAVLPILHLNGFKIANPTVLARISHEELEALLRGYGYDPHFVEGDDPAVVHQSLAGTLDTILARIREIQATARSGGEAKRPRWPMIVFRTPKGWTGPKFVDGKPVEGTWRAHQVPIANFQNPEHLRQLEDWMKSYRPHELFDDGGKFREEFFEIAPTGRRRMGSNPHANGGDVLVPLSMPHFRDHAIAVSAPGTVKARKPRRNLGKFLRDVMEAESAKAGNFRLFGPDETASNRLEAVYEVSGKQWMADIEDVDVDLSPDGRVMEVLSEHLCEGWLEGYLLTGRHGLFSCYEAFVHIIDAMFNQHAKWLKACRHIPWRKPDRVAELPAHLASCGGRIIMASRTRTRASSTTSPTRAPTSSVSTCRPTRTACCRWRTTACAAATT